MLCCYYNTSELGKTQLLSQMHVSIRINFLSLRGLYCCNVVAYATLCKVGADISRYGVTKKGKEGNGRNFNQEYTYKLVFKVCTFYNKLIGAF